MNKRTFKQLVYVIREVSIPIFLALSWTALMSFTFLVLFTFDICIWLKLILIAITVIYTHIVGILFMNPNKVEKKRDESQK